MKFFNATLFLTFLTVARASGQCGPNEVELRVDILTDVYGGETYWTISDQTNNIVLSGGQGGVYGNNMNYSDSICAPTDGCYFFEIWDTYGDGIFAPGGYEFYVDDVLVSSGADDIEAYAIETIHCPASCSMVEEALNQLSDHINELISLSGEELLEIRDVFNTFPECFSSSEGMILFSKDVIEDFDNTDGPLFMTPATEYGFSKDPDSQPGLELEHAMIALEQGVFDFVFTPEIYEVFPQHLYQWKFNACANFPGDVSPPADSTLNREVLIRANFEDPAGMNPYFNINSDGTQHVLRPTGLYLAPGSFVSVTVPAELVGQDFFVRVGSHEWDLSNKPAFRRLDRISKKFPILSTVVDIFNPFGGAISILVPYGADYGNVEVIVNNGVEAPFFSLKSFHQTENFDTELDKPGPWAVFETENVMYTVPKHSIVPGANDLEQTLRDWETALRGLNSIMAREIIPDKHTMYMICDLMIRGGAFSIGYPLSNSQFNYIDVPGTSFFMNGPGPDDEVNFHELGHALAMSKFPGEIEAIVNLPYIMALNNGLGTDLNEAVRFSFGPNTYDIDYTATHRLVSNTFGNERDISDTTTDEVRYQHRGYGHYFEIVNLMGWCPLRNFWKQEYIDFENGINHGINDQDTDSRIIRMSVAAQADLRPLFHVFGILPQNPSVVQDTLALLGVAPSLLVYNRLQDYFDLIPEDNAAFVNYALAIYPDLNINGPLEDTAYGVGWHYQKSLTYNMAEAEQRAEILQDIIDLYYPNGQPPSNNNPEVCCLLDALSIDLVDDEIIVEGGTPPYEITIDTSENYLTATVMDFDSCLSIVQFPITNLSELSTKNTWIYPNPTSGMIQIDLGTPQEQVTISTLDVTGKLINTHTIISSKLINYQLPEPAGVYIIDVTYANGNKQSFKVVKE